MEIHVFKVIKCNLSNCSTFPGLSLFFFQKQSCLIENKINVTDKNVYLPVENWTRKKRLSKYGITWSLILIGRKLKLILTDHQRDMTWLCYLAACIQRDHSRRLPTSLASHCDPTRLYPLYPRRPIPCMRIIFLLLAVSNR